MHFIRNSALNNKELKKFGLSSTVVLLYIFKLCYKELKSS